MKRVMLAAALMMGGPFALAQAQPPQDLEQRKQEQYKQQNQQKEAHAASEGQACAQGDAKCAQEKAGNRAKEVGKAAGDALNRGANELEKATR